MGDPTDHSGRAPESARETYQPSPGAAFSNPARATAALGLAAQAAPGSADGAEVPVRAGRRAGPAPGGAPHPHQGRPCPHHGSPAWRLRAGRHSDRGRQNPRRSRPDIAVSRRRAAQSSMPTNRIVIPGFIDTHSHSYQGILRSIMPNGVLEPDYNRDVQTTLTPAFTPAGRLCRRADDGARHDRHGHDGGGRSLPDQPHAGAQRRVHAGRCRDSGIRAVYRLFARTRARPQLWPQDIGRIQRSVFQFGRPAADAWPSASQPRCEGAGRSARGGRVPAVLHLRSPAPSAGPRANWGAPASLRAWAMLFIHCTRPDGGGVAA